MTYWNKTTSNQPLQARHAGIPARISQAAAEVQAAATYSSPSELTAQPLLSSKEAATYLDIAPQTLAVWRSTRRYRLPFVKIGRTVKYRLPDLQAFIAANRCDTINSVIGSAA